MISWKNFMGQPSPDVGDETVFEHCQFTQPEPHTELFPGRGLPCVFRFCNLKNCDLPVGSTREQGLHGHSVRDPANDETMTIDGFSITQEAFRWEKVV